MTARAPAEPPLQQVVSDLFRDVKGDEIGGRHAIRGFAFQVWHAVLEALRAHATTEDYAVVLEWQQDIAVLNSSTKPTSVRFVQLKKNESSVHWKLRGLLAPESTDSEAANDRAVAGSSEADKESAIPSGGEKPRTGKKPKKPKQSVLAKLYAHRRRFKGLKNTALEFASNAPFEVPDGSGGTITLHRAKLHELDSTVRLEVEQKLREQLEVPGDETVDLQDFELLVTDCTVNEPHKFVAGELAEMQMNGEVQLSGKATMLAVLIIASYVNLRAGRARFAADFSELLERAVTRTDIANYLAAANDNSISTSDHVDAVIDRLNTEHVSYAIVRRMRRESSRACVHIADRSTGTPVLAARMKALYVANGEYAHIPLLKDAFSKWYEDIEALKLPDFSLYSREYFYCLMAMICEDANPTKQLPSVSVGPKSEKEE